MYTKDEKTEIWLDSFHLEYPKKAQLYKLCAAPYDLVKQFAKYRSQVGEIVGEESIAAMEKSLSSGEYMRSLLAKYTEKGITCATFSSELYPEELRQIPDPPLVLYARGNLQLLRERKLAVVGSRRTPPAMMKQAERFSSELSEHFIIVTGLAEGGDTAAALGALESGKLICVLAYGFDFVYPECNRSLLKSVKAVKSGLALTEYVPWQGPKKYLFPARNRIIAGLADGVLVVSGGIKSGTRITADYAYEYGKDVFAFPYSLGAAAGEGCNALIKDYAKLTDNLVDIFAAFGINLTEAEEISLSEAERTVFEIIREGEIHVAQIAEKSGLKVYELPAILTALQMKKLIVSCGGNRYMAVR